MLGLCVLGALGDPKDPVPKGPGAEASEVFDSRALAPVGAKPTPVSKGPGALATGALDTGACSVADEVPPAAKAPGD